MGAQEYLSYSSMKLWLGCGKSFYLKKVENITELPSWWFVGGRAVHTVTEQYDKHLWETEGR